MPAILLAEDLENDALLLQRAFDRVAIKNPIFVVENGEEAISYLSGQGKYFDRSAYPIPAMAILDIKMPKLDGFEVLEWIRKSPNYSSLYVVILSSSDLPSDIDRAHKLGVNGYLVKPTDFSRMVEIGRQLGDMLLRAEL